MSQTEAEMWAAMSEKTSETGQYVYSGPTTLTDEATKREMFDRGWQELSLTGSIARSNALALSIAIQCADIKARDISKVDMLLWQRDGRGWKMVDPSANPIARLLMEKPNDTDMTWAEFWRMTVVHYELAQNAYIYKDIALDGTILGLYPIMPSRCRMLVSASNRLYYEIMTGTDYERVALGQEYFVVPAERMIHIKGRLLDGVNGLSSLVLGNPTFDLMNSISQYQTSLFANNGRQTLVFETDTIFDDDAKSDLAFRRLKEQLRDAARKASVNGDPILLEAGLKAKAVSVNAKESSTTESYNQQVMRICGLMHTPPHKIYALEAVAYNNMETLDRSYANDSLLPTAVTIEGKMRNQLISRNLWARYSPQFDRAQLMANDPKSLDALVKTGMSTGLMSINEGRDALPFRLNHLAEGGDDRTVPVNMALVKPDGTVRQAADGQNPTNPGAGEDQSPDNNAPKHLRVVGGNGE